MTYKTIAFSLLFLVLTAFTRNLPATNTTIAKASNATYNAELSVEASLLKMDDLFLGLYNEIKGNATKPSFPLFKKALTGYYNLIGQGKLEKKNILTIIDFTLSSDQKRLWIIDLVKKEVVLNDLVAHGRNTGNIMAENFSNIAESHMSSLGFYITDNTYYGKHGLSLRLNGIEAGFNENAYDRAIVVHGAAYVSEDFVQRNGRLGRSYGCPAVSNEVAATVIDTIKDKSCLFIYASALDYENRSALLNTHSAAQYLSAQDFIL